MKKIYWVGTCECGYSHVKPTDNYCAGCSACFRPISGAIIQMKVALHKAWRWFDSLPERFARWLEENDNIESERECGS
jgi:hypothetical protein